MKGFPRGGSRPSIFPLILRRLLAALAITGAASMLAACLPTGGGGGNQAGDFSLSAPTSKVESQPLPGTAGPDTIGSGPVKVALIVPLTQSSGPSVVGTSLRNAAELAMAEAGNNDLTLLIKDDHSTPDGARAAAQAAVADGAELFLGPLFAPNVREVAQVARAAGKPVIAFSTDASAAGPNLYLLSFLIENYVDRVIDFAASRGKKSIAALIPDNDYGRVAEAEFQQAAARRGMRVMEIEHYNAQTLNAAVQKIAALGGQIDSLFIPEQADAMPAMSQALVAAGIDGKKIQILGTGIWNDARVMKLPALQDAWFAAPENNGFNSFAERYRAKFGSDPTRIATLSYDAVSLAAALARMQGSQRFSETVLTNHSGFNGADGVFRFRTNGENERGLSVLQINNGGAVPLSPAPKSFAGIPSAT
ncbi:penicillin-binding protein activator [Methyloferula stellata]|uniref:penicillin-binding protein activator n=1 Tax=Methyloferula stellata TaxID=876270 RepID=UPI000365EBD8|nr:penicillin-binding protein activator [Methyloferula stellata]